MSPSLTPFTRNSLQSGGFWVSVQLVGGHNSGLSNPWGVERAEAEAIYDAGREVVVEVLLAMDRRIQQLEARVEKLERQLGRTRATPRCRRALIRRVGAAGRGKDRSGRAQGGQPVMRATAASCCRRGRSMRSSSTGRLRCGCGHVFAEAERVAVGEPARHQVEELPVLAVRVIEHRCQRVRCPGCGGDRRAAGRGRPQRVRSALSGGRRDAVGAQPRLAPRRGRAL